MRVLREVMRSTTEYGEDCSHCGDAVDAEPEDARVISFSTHWYTVKNAKRGQWRSDGGAGGWAIEHGFLCSSCSAYLVEWLRKGKA